MDRRDVLIRVLVVACFGGLAMASLALALWLPLFSHVDEIEHVDYSLKLARGKIARPSLVVEDDLVGIAAQEQERAWRYYFDLAVSPEVVRRQPILSFQAYHPPLHYVLGAAVLKAGLAAGMPLAGVILLLRCVCALLAVAAHIVLFRALWLLGPPYALAALPFLAFAAPVDLLRVSNDSGVTLVGALVFLVIVRAACAPRPRCPSLALAALLVLAGGIKQNAVLFLLPATLVCLCFLRHDVAFRARDVALIALPVVLLNLFLGTMNYHATGNISGLPEEMMPYLVPPEGMRPGLLVPTADRWLHWHKKLLQPETLCRGRAGAALFPVGWTVTVVLVGMACAVVVALFVRPREEQPGSRAARRLTLAAAVTIAFTISLIGLLSGVYGRFVWNGRQFLLIEFLVLVASATGWVWLVERLPRWRIAAGIVAWIGAAALFSAITVPYLAALGVLR